MIFISYISHIKKIIRQFKDPKRICFFMEADILLPYKYFNECYIKVIKSNNIIG